MQAAGPDQDIVGSVSAVPAPQRSTERVSYRVHRSPIRGEGLTIMVLPGGQEPAAAIESRIEIPDLEAISFNQVCRGSDNARLACGMRARINLVNFIARQPMECEIESGTAGPQPTVQSCTVKGADLGEWLVRHGIARPLRNGSYQAAEREAQIAGLGMWSDAEKRSRIGLARAN